MSFRAASSGRGDSGLVLSTESIVERDGLFARLWRLKNIYWTESTVLT